MSIIVEIEEVLSSCSYIIIDKKTSFYIGHPTTHHQATEFINIT